VRVRSGDGSLVYAPYGSPASGMAVYNTSTKNMSTINARTDYGPVEAVNSNGSELILETSFTSGVRGGDDALAFCLVVLRERKRKFEDLVGNEDT
jgi:hypothetical protein